MPVRPVQGRMGVRSRPRRTPLQTNGHHPDRMRGGESMDATELEELWERIDNWQEWARELGEEQVGATGSTVWSDDARIGLIRTLVSEGVATPSEIVEAVASAEGTTREAMGAAAEQVVAENPDMEYDEAFEILGSESLFPLELVVDRAVSADNRRRAAEGLPAPPRNERQQAEYDARKREAEDDFPPESRGPDPLMSETLSPEAKRLFGGQGGFVPPPPVSPSPSLLGGTNFAMSGGEGQLFDPGQRQPIPESKRRYGLEELRRIRAGEPPQTPVPLEEDEGESRAEPPLDAVPATEEEEALIAEEEGRTGDETLDESTFSAMRSLQTVPQGFQPVTGDLGSGGLSLRDAALIATAIAGLGLTGGGSGIVGGALKAAPAVGRAAAAGGTGLLALLGLAGPASAETPADASPAGAAVRALRDHRRGRSGRVGR